MRAVPHTDLAGYWELAEPVYRADPVRNTVALTVLSGLLTEPDPTAKPPLLVTFEDNGTTVGAAFCTPPWPISVSGMPDVAAPELVALVRELGFPVTGVTGPLEATEQVSKEWQVVTGAEVSLGFKLRLYRLDELTPPEVAGTARVATDDDIPLLARWRLAFGQDTGHMPEEDHADIVRRSMALGNGTVLWEVDGTAVSYASATKPVEGMSRIGPVYTPVEHRGHGYGSAVTAAVTQWALDRGAEHVVLFTDLANPTSNSIYQRIGFRPHSDAADYRFKS
ncbi:GNAT family N-acetyltransferase [Labedaea rhizosphaerae]|uniref:Putative GNAT family acetyltransferase n=1 Tax=Labedaea rhizosphaerae TaxID=598644 RepID=A0A4R6RQS7_LABRH|nr:GNAT family N-acetyltransferase [Labedaea rhizosphaerae]TDP89080.1 putative GNAT family acetyltransferase [Labedaea rhizosphaerae]